MFRKIVSNLAFSPALVGQLGFYAKRLRKEETTRRVGLIFTALALVVQLFAIITPPETANAATGNDIIYGGFKSKSQLLQIYDQNRDSAGHTDIQQIYAHFGITRQDIVNGTDTTFNSRDFNLGIQSIGRSAAFSWTRTPIAIPGTSTTVYSSQIYKFDSTPWTIPHGSQYEAIVGKRAVDGKWFAIMFACGNAAYLSLPPPPPPPTAACSGLSIIPITRTKFTLKASATTANGASISGYTYTVKAANGSTVFQQTIESSQPTSQTTTYDLTQNGTYQATVVVNTSSGQVTSPNCQRALTVSPVPACSVNPALPADSPDCKSCGNNTSIWYKDVDCQPEFQVTKTVSNITQLITDANNTTAKPGDSLEYTLHVTNVGKTTGAYTIVDDLSDVLDYADLVDTGGGTLTQPGPNIPVEDVDHVTWPSVQLNPGASIEKIINVQVKSTIPATPQSPGNPGSFDCRMMNNFGITNTIVNVDCPPPKVVEQVVTELPHTGPTENILFAGIVFAVVTYFYARSRQLKKEVRLIRRDLNAGTL